MSNQQNDYIFETFYEDFLEQGHSEKQAQKLAQECVKKNYKGC